MRRHFFILAVGCGICLTAIGCNCPMSVAIANRDNSRVKELLSSGADPNGVNDGKTYLDQAVARDDVGIVSTLVAAGADVNKTDVQGQTAIFSATGKDMAKWLISHGARINVVDKEGNTPLHCVSSCSCSPEMIAFYVAAGVDINAVNNKGETPLCRMTRDAAYDDESISYSSISVSELRKKCLDKVKEFVRLGGKIDILNADGMSPIHYAAQGPSPELLEFFIARRADVNLKTKDGLTPLFCAAISECPENMDILVKAGADIKGQLAPDGLTPLHLASAAMCAVNVKKLVAYGVNVNGVDRDTGQTALHVICKKLIPGSATSHFAEVPKQSSRLWKITGGKSRIEAEREIVQTLLTGGVNARLKDSRGHTAVEIAREQGREDIAKLIDVARMN